GWRMIHASDRLTVGTLGTLMPPAANLGKNAGRNEEQGYAALWWPDHYMGWFPQILWTPDITPLAAFQRIPDIFFDPLVAIAAPGPRMLEITGRYADGWLPEFLPLDDYRERLQRIQHARGAAGRAAEPFTPGMYVKLVLTDQHEQAHTLMTAPLLRILALTQPAEAFARHGATHPLGEKAFGVRDFIPVRFTRDQILELIDGVPPAVVEAGVLHGTPEEVAEQLAAYARAGLRHVVLWNVTFFGDASLIRRSYQLMGSLLEMLREIRVGEWAASNA